MPRRKAQTTGLDALRRLFDHNSLNIDGTEDPTIAALLKLMQILGIEDPLEQRALWRDGDRSVVTNRMAQNQEFLKNEAVHRVLNLHDLHPEDPAALLRQFERAARWVVGGRLEFGLVEARTGSYRPFAPKPWYARLGREVPKGVKYRCQLGAE